MSSIGVVLDACVLYPGSLRDTLLRTAIADKDKMFVTEKILEETRTNLIKKGEMSEKQADRLFGIFREQFSETLVTNYELIIPSMPINPKDRHVLAAAVVSGSEYIVTLNLKDFPPNLLEPFEIEALSPDEFLTDNFYHDYETMTQIIIEQANNLRNPPTTPIQLLNRLKIFTPKFSALVQTELPEYLLSNE